MNFYKDVAPTIETVDGDKVNVNDIVVNSKVIPELVDNGRKNLLKITSSSEVINGVTFTVGTDGSITVNGTATAEAWFYVDPEMQSYNGTYVLSGCPSRGSRSTFELQMASWNFRDFGDGVTFTKTNESSSVAIGIRSGYKAVNLVFRPMICTKEAWDVSHEYVPYKPDAFSTAISVLSESDLDTFRQGCITTSPSVTVAGFAAGTWMVIRTYILNPAANRKMQIIETQYGDRKTRFYNGSSWDSWV